MGALLRRVGCLWMNPGSVVNRSAHRRSCPIVRSADGKCPVVRGRTNFLEREAGSPVSYLASYIDM